MEAEEPGSEDDGFRSIGAIALPLAGWRLSQSLTNLVEDAVNPHPDVGFVRTFLPDHLRQEALAALTRLDAMALPAPPLVMAQWLNGINNGMTQPLSPPEFAARAGETLNVLATLPGGVFTPETRAEAVRAFEWFPGVAQLTRLLAPHTLPVLSRQRALRRLLEAPPPPARPSNKPDDIGEREAILADFRGKMALITAERAGSVSRTNPTTDAPRYLSRAQLRAAYEQQARSGNAAAEGIARIRLTMLDVAEVAPPLRTQALDPAEVAD